MRWASIGLSLHFLIGCATSSKEMGGAEAILLQSVPAPAGKTSKDGTKIRGSSESENPITIRELGRDGRLTLRKRSPGDLRREQEVRVFVLRVIEAPHMDPHDPSARIEDWELFSVLEALLTRDIRWKNVGSLQFDRQTACFIVRDTPPVIDRIEDLLRTMDPDPPASSRLQKLLEEREAAERLELKGSGLDPGHPRERGHLMIGRIPELLKKAGAAVASTKPGQSTRELLRGPLLDLRDEIDRIHGVPRAPREY